MKNFSQFTNLYPLTKTLRFELKPEEETQKHFDKWLREIEENGEEEINSENLFFKDRKIAEAYIVLKPILDKIHENFINVSLNSITKKQIDFSRYLDRYKNKKGDISVFEKELREEIGKSFLKGKEYYSNEFNRLKIKVKEKSKSPYKLITDKTILDYIEKNVSSFATDELSENKIKEHLSSFKGFYTYFGGFNENRANYYCTEKEKSTAVATRIIHENLPMFCDNIIRFEKRKEEYLSVYEYIKKNNIITQIKDVEKNKFNEVIPIETEYFKISYFNKCLSQQQIEDYNKIIGNFNLLVNLYNQVKEQEDKTFKKLDSFVLLFKQIGCGKRKYNIAKIIKDREDDEPKGSKSSSGNILSVEALLQEVQKAGEKYFNVSGNNDVTIITFLNYLKFCGNWEGIYWSKTALSAISKKYFSNWYALLDKLKEGRKSCVSYDKNDTEEPIKLRDAVELSELFDVLNKEKNEFIFKDKLIEDKLVDIDITPNENLINLICNEIKENINQFKELSKGILGLKSYRQSSNENFVDEDDKIIQQIKDWFDISIKPVQIVRYFSVPANKKNGHIANTDIEMMLNKLLSNDDVDWFGWYDMVRNYLTQKPQEKAKENKLKLNFGKSTLLKGFTDSHTESDNATQYGGYIFRKKNNICDEYEYFIGISKNSQLFRCHLKDTISQNDYCSFERLDYYQMKKNTPYPNSYDYQKGLIRKIVCEKINASAVSALERKEANKISKEDTPKKLYNSLLNSKSFKWVLKDKTLLKEADKTIKEILQHCQKYTRIDAMRNLLTKTYCGFVGLAQLINDLDDITSIKIFDFFHISKAEFNQHNGIDLFIFKISNKDLSYCETFTKGLRKEKSLQRENLHTIFFRALMREEGYGDVIDIGSGELFFREKAINYNETIWSNGHHVESLKNKFKYPVISLKRFAKDKYLLHLSVKLNYKAKTKNIEENLRNSISEIKNINYIGVDRGEKHLVYICKIDADSTIKVCEHFDVINGTNYVEKLEEKAKNRTKQRQNWQEQDKIKSLKEGYISHVVHRLTETVIKDDNGNINPNAYIVLEDLNSEMKRGRQKFEQQIYQNLETALAKKLNFIVDKCAKKGEIASVSHALQLTPELKNYENIKGKKQFGIMLYTRANYTSVTDPATGWRQTIYLKNGSEDCIKKQIMDLFDDFGFDGEDYFFKYTEKNVGKVWCMYSGYKGNSLPRFRNKKSVEHDFNIWIPEAVDIVSLLNKLFEGFDKKVSFKVQIENGLKLKKIGGRNETAWQTLRFIISLIQQIRNSGNNKKDDNFLYSPVRDSNGLHFDTRNAVNNGNLKLIVDADANGAYNIARKGLIMDAHIKYFRANKKSDSELNLFVSDKEWDMWLLDRQEWEKQLPNFALNNNKKYNK